MRDVDAAADKTLCKFKDQICTFSFKSEDVSHLIDDTLFTYQQTKLQSSTDNDKKKFVIDAIRVNPSSDVFPAFIGILDSYPASRDVVQNMEGMMIF